MKYKRSLTSTYSTVKHKTICPYLTSIDSNLFTFIKEYMLPFFIS